MRRLRWHYGSAAPVLDNGSGMYEGWVQAVPNVVAPTSFKVFVRNVDNDAWDEVVDTGTLAGLPNGGTAGQALVKQSGVDGDADWVTGAWHTPDLPPASPNAMDDEFDGVSLDVKWTWTNQGTATATPQAGALLWTNPGQSGDQQRQLIQTIPTPTGDYDFRVKVGAMAPPTASSYRLASLVLYESGTTQRCSVGLNCAAGGILYDVRKSTGNTGANTSVGSTLAALLNHSFYLRVAKVSTNITYSVSGDGRAWVVLATRTETQDHTTRPDRVGLLMTDNITGAWSSSFEWFRRVA